MKIAASLMCAVLAVPAAFAADSAATAPPAPTTPAQDAKISKRDEVVCKTYPPPIGSLLGARRICHTEAEWREITKDSQDAVLDAQRRAAIQRLPGN